MVGEIDLENLTFGELFRKIGNIRYFKASLQLCDGDLPVLVKSVSGKIKWFQLLWHLLSNNGWATDSTAIFIDFTDYCKR